MKLGDLTLIVAANLLVTAALINYSVALTEEQAVLVSVAARTDDGRLIWKSSDGDLICWWDHYWLFKKRLFCEDQNGDVWQYGKLPTRQKSEL
jgi:hypothetical protein